MIIIYEEEEAMFFQEPRVEIVEINMEDVIVTSGCNGQTDACPDVASHEKPSVQTCSTGAMQDESCDDPLKNW